MKKGIYVNLTAYLEGGRAILRLAMSVPALSLHYTGKSTEGKPEVRPPTVAAFGSSITAPTLLVS